MEDLLILPTNKRASVLINRLKQTDYEGRLELILKFKFRAIELTNINTFDIVYSPGAGSFLIAEKGKEKMRFKSKSQAFDEAIRLRKLIKKHLGKR